MSEHTVYGFSTGSEHVSLLWRPFEVILLESPSLLREVILRETPEV